jgi:hypothetical protein
MGVRFVGENSESAQSQLERPLAISRDRARKQVLDLVKNTRTCGLALELCLLVRTNRAILEKQDVHDCCNFISKLCEEAGCQEASELCAKASEAVLVSEKVYLELCEHSLKRCSESRQPKRQQHEKATYVA